ncbi:OPA3-like protein [Wickerhamiella sorbophila]|uniref:OPA3-like protein n=1 Tax=Wickerhamiella sorbophila TaxID=45607 RepID=A0A2T0FHR7_9ASCO|nr:OPA3-like protein [Wickerhamiella sorbophila]PRT54534.1 OPA3-like protein [Wickerhamiella sorbophila]
MSLALKFTSLLVKTLAKPIANTIKANAKEHPSFRKFCISFAQKLHQTDVKLRLKLLNEKNIKVRPLNDAKAIQSGATFISEAFVFSVAGSLVFFESWRSRRKEQARQASIVDDIQVLQDEIEWLKAQLSAKKIIDADNYVVPDNIEPTVLKLKHKGEKDQAVSPPEPPKLATATTGIVDKK